MNSRRPSLTVGEVARQFGVAPATIQRWVDRGRLRAERTAGKHRRIPISEVRRLAAKIEPFRPDRSASLWLDALFSGESPRVKASLLAARRLHGGWARAADEVASAIVQIGRRWESGLCKVFEEHCASEALRRATAICAEDIPRADKAPLVAIFSAQGERHTLGLSLAELVLAEGGWRVMWLGEGPPHNELGKLVSMRKPSLIVVSASTASKVRSIRAYQNRLIAAAREAGTAVILGGRGPWQPSRFAKRALTFEDLHRVSAQTWQTLQSQL